MAVIHKYLQTAIQARASDIHFASGEPVRARIDGDLVPLTETTLNSEQVQAILYEVLNENEQARFEKNLNLDKSYSIEGVGNFRVNIFRTRKGISAVIRTIPINIPTLDELGLPDSIRNLTSYQKGLILVTGPTGSGKSTTLSALINHININCPYHILTVEDPIEFIHPSKASLVNQREIGSNCPTFAEALKFALREDPDVILVGEMRDLETISLALTAAETGHLVFGTLHTRGASASIDRIIDSFPANQQSMIRAMLSESLAAVISQSLLKKADGTGRVAAYEIMVVNQAISNLIREGKTFQIPTILQTARKDGMILMEQHIVDLVSKGIVSKEEAEAYLEHPGILQGIKVNATGQAPAGPRGNLSLVKDKEKETAVVDLGESDGNSQPSLSTTEMLFKKSTETTQSKIMDLNMLAEKEPSFKSGELWVGPAETKEDSVNQPINPVPPKVESQPAPMTAPPMPPTPPTPPAPPSLGTKKMPPPPPMPKKANG